MAGFKRDFEDGESIWLDGARITLTRLGRGKTRVCIEAPAQKKIEVESSLTREELCARFASLRGAPADEST